MIGVQIEGAALPTELYGFDVDWDNVPLTVGEDDFNRASDRSDTGTLGSAVDNLKRPGQEPQVGRNMNSMDCQRSWSTVCRDS